MLLNLLKQLLPVQVSDTTMLNQGTKAGPTKELLTPSSPPVFSFWPLLLFLTNNASFAMFPGEEHLPFHPIIELFLKQPFL
jgi:hypothetical protein